MDSVLAFTTKNAAVIVTDMTQNQDIFVLDLQKDKIREPFGHHLMPVTGDPGASCSHTDYIMRDLSLQYYHANKTQPTVNACANFIREGIWESIRDHPIKVKVCYAGVDEDGTPSLYTVDEYGCLMKPDHIAQNYAMYFSLAVFDKYWNPDLDRDGIIDLVKKTITVLNRRFMLQQHRFLIKIATKDGIERIPIDYIPEMLEKK